MSHFWQLDTDARMVLIARVLVLMFVVVTGVSAIVVDGAPFFTSYGDVAGWAKVLSFVAMVAAVFLVARQDTYYPFVAQATLPTGLLRDAPYAIGCDSPVDVKGIVGAVPDGTALLYWDLHDPSCAGLATVRDRTVELKLSKRTRQVAYRRIRGKDVVGPVRTLYIN